MLDARSKQLRRDTIALSKANGGYHYGGSFSIVEILRVLYDKILTDDDKFILSKGHACWPYYVLLREKGYTPFLEGHPVRDKYNGIWCTTGSLGHGLPTGIGMAMAKKLKKESGQIFVLMGDGECQEGTLWESLLIAAHQKLDNLIVIIDSNGIQGSGYLGDILPLPSFEFIARSMNWYFNNVDGHCIDKLFDMLTISSNFPKLIVAHTVKGKGISYMENDPKWHSNWIDPEHEKIAIEELL